MAVEPSAVSSVASSPVKGDKPPRTGKFCHQCRQNRENVATCKNQKDNKPCSIRLCNKCLLNRYGENAEEVLAQEDWICPKCRGICNCSVCRKRSGHQPTGILIKRAKATGFSSVLEMLLKSPERANHENEAVLLPCQMGQGNSFAGNLDANFPAEKDSENGGRDQLGETSNGKVNKKRKGTNADEMKPKKSRSAGLDENGDGLNLQTAEFHLPVGTELTTVSKIDICAEDVGNALQFLEFCYVFGKILDVKEGEAECVLQDLLHGGTARLGKFSLPVLFHKRILSMIETERKEKCAASSTCGKNSWFHSLKKCLSESQHILKISGVDLENVADYETLSASDRLRVLNLLCDEVLGTEQVRNWLDQQNTEFLEKVKEAKRRISEVKGKEKEKTNDDTAKEIVDGGDADRSIPEQEAVVSRSKSEAAEAHAQLLESEDVLLTSKRTCDALRIQPIFTDPRGHVFWQLNHDGKSDVLHQVVGNGDDTLTSDEKWFTLDAQGKEAIEKHVSSLRRRRRR